MIDYEDARTKFLNRRAIEVLRIPNELLTEDAPMVAGRIKWAIAQRAVALTRPSATLSRSAGKGR